MRLEIDIGNTRIKWRYVEGARVIERGSAFHEQDLNLAVFGGSLGSVESILVASVASERIKKSLYESANSKGLGACIRFIEAASNMGGLRFAYADPSRLGVDRCLAMIGAYHELKKGVLVVDCGSAITADYVSKDGVHLGGYILPGVNILRESLLKGTARVIVDSDAELATTPGISTEECVDHGRYFLLQSLIASLKLQSQEMGIEGMLITGGDGEVLARLSSSESDYRPDLVFEGMSHVVSVL